MTIGVVVYTDASGKVGTSTVYAGDDYTEFGTADHPSGSGCPDVSVDGAAVGGQFCTSPDGAAGYTFANKATSGGGPDGILYPGAHVVLTYHSTPTGPQIKDFIWWPPLHLGPDPIYSPPAPSYLTQAGIGTPYTAALIATGGQPTTPVYAFTVTSGTLPPGLSLNSATGVISGTATTLGDYAFNVQLSDGVSSPTSGYFDITVGSFPGLDLGPDPIGSAPAAILPTATAGQPYTFPLTASGGGPGTPVYTFTNTSGLIPPGLSVNAATGVISGTATVQGTYTFSVRLKDNLPSPPVIINYQITVAGLVLLPQPVPNASRAILPSGSTFIAYSSALHGSGGTAPYTYTVTSGPLPPGLTLNSVTGVISGTPTTAGNYAFTVRLSDAVATPPVSGNFQIAIASVGPLIPPSGVGGGGTPVTIMSGS